MSHLVSVIIPTYNRSSLINRCLQSVAVQSYRPLEVILVNDGSIPEEEVNYEEIVSTYKSKIDVRLITKENGGLSSARNLGVTHAKGDYLQFLDDDDEILPDKIRNQMAIFISNPAINFVYSDVMVRKKDSEEAYKGVPDSQFKTKLMEANFIPCHGYILRKDKAIDIHFDERLSSHEDYDFLLRNLSKLKPAYLPEIQAIYHFSYSGTMTGNRKKMLMTCFEVRVVQYLHQFINFEEGGASLKGILDTAIDLIKYEKNYQYEISSAPEKEFTQLIRRLYWYEKSWFKNNKKIIADYPELTRKMQHHLVKIFKNWEVA